MSGMNKETLAGFADVVLDSKEDNDVIDSFNKTERSAAITESFKTNESNDNDTITTVKDSGNQDNDTDNSTKIDADLDLDASTNDSGNQDNDTDNSVDVTDSFKQDNDVDASTNITDSFKEDNDVNTNFNDSFNKDESVNDSYNTDIDLDIDNSRQVFANDGGVAAGGDLTGTINTGALKGVQSGGPTAINESTIGDGNINLENVSGNVALGGSVTDIDGGAGPINFGGTQFNTTALGGNANTIVGDGNDVSGDQAAYVAGNEGPTNVNFGDDVGQKAVETNDNDVDNSVDITDSFTSDDDLIQTHSEETNTDVHIEDSFQEDNSLDLDADLDFDLTDIDVMDNDHSGIHLDG